MARRRAHSKIETELPPELIEKVNAFLATPGKTYQDVVDYLQDEGYEISHSSVGRYGKRFLSRLEKIKTAREQAKVIVNEAGDRPTSELTEATNQVAIQMILETLLDIESIDLDDIKLKDLFKSVALLERSAADRDKIKMEYRQRVQDSASKVKDTLSQNKKIDQETINLIEREILGIVR